MKQYKPIFLIALLLIIWQPINGQILKKIKNTVDQAGKKIEQTIDKESSKSENEKNKSTTGRKEVSKPVIESYSMLNIPAPNNNFESISIQEFRGLPRVGLLYNYDMNDKSLPNSAERIAKYKMDRKEFQKYVTLLELKLRGNLYDEMDLEMPYDINQKKVGSRQVGSYESNANNVACQIGLLSIGRELTTEKAYPKYFCNLNNKCNNNRGETLNWGGLLANEFEKIECYKNLVKDNLTDLRNSENKMTDEAYVIMSTTFESYDFSKGGFPINIYLTVSYDKSGFDPINGIGSKLHEENNQIRLIEMSSDDGRKLLDRNSKRRIFTVWKIKYHSLTESKILSPTQSPTRNFHLQSPVVELFEDEALTKKLGEITIE